MSAQKLLAILAAWSLTIPMQAQQPFVVRPQSRILWRPYQAPTISPVNLQNSDRLHALIRGGKLYLTLQDAIAVAIENNLDLEVDRYGPLNAEWNLERAEAGGPLRGVTTGSSLVNQVTQGQGVAGAIASAGLGGGGGGGGGGGTNAVIQQIGPVTQNLDPVFQNATAWSHTTSPQANPQISQTSALVDTTHRFNSFVQQGLLSGGFVQIAANESYLKENTPSDLLNPSVAPVAQLYLRHSLLNDFGVGVNSRFIRVARNQVSASTDVFRLQLLGLVAGIVNRYWDLVSANDDLQAKQHARDVADQFFKDTQNRIRVGEIAGAEIYRAQGELSARTQEVAISQASVSQQEIELKNVLSRNGLEDPLVDQAQIVTLDRIDVPMADTLPPLRELVDRALAQRPDIALAKINDQNQKISLLGTASGILPSLQGVLSTTNRATAGTANPLFPEPPNPKIVGGLGTALGQIFRHDFTSRQAMLTFQASIGNHVAQADYGIDQLQAVQDDLVERRDRNQLVVDISNQMIALRQARSRYSLAVDSRMLQEELLDKEQQSFLLGNSTVDLVIAAQRTLFAAQYTEVAARAAYSRARVALDQVLGQTLEANHVSVDEALKGR